MADVPVKAVDVLNLVSAADVERDALVDVLKVWLGAGVLVLEEIGENCTYVILDCRNTPMELGNEMSLCWNRYGKIGPSDAMTVKVTVAFGVRP